MKNIKKISVLAMILMMLCACVTKTEETRANKYQGKSVEEIVDSLTIEQKAARMVLDL